MVSDQAGLRSYEEALELVSENRLRLGEEVLPLDLLMGRTLSRAILARHNQPRFDSSAVDGYAFCEADIRSGLGDSSYKVLGEIAAGSADQMVVEPGHSVRVFTGAPLPIGTGAVVMQEYVQRDGELIWCAESVILGENVRREAEEARAGDSLVPARTIVTPAVIGVISAAGHIEAEVFRQPQIAILVTGNELAKPGSALETGQIFESNSFALSAAIRALGLPPPEVRFCRDTSDSLREVISELLSSCDILLTTGGVSVGDYDLVRPVLAELGVEEVFWGVAIKPGKPVFFGKRVTAVAGETVVYGLPGNPVSALVAFMLFVKPMIAETTSVVKRFLVTSIKKKRGRMEFVPATFDDDDVQPMTARASHKTTSLVGANGLIVLNEEVEEMELGAEVDVLPLTWGWEPTPQLLRFKWKE